MTRTLFTLPLAALLAADAAADFSGAQASLHPRFPGSGPFIVEVSGDWPSDCHPGEQKPVVTSFDGQTATIGFEFIVEHVTCNDVETPYRVLLDMSAALRETAASGDTVTIVLDYDGAGFQQTLDLVCSAPGGCDDAPADATRPEVGLFDAADLDNQGLLVARQNGATGIFPLVYDESGRGEWLFSGNHMTGDSFFADILRPSGGDCFGCEPGASEPVLTPVGHLSLLVDGPGLMQVKVNDGLFIPYRKSVFGYKSYQLGGPGTPPLIDLDGRWGISENHGSNPPLGDITEILPGAFDIELEYVNRSDGGAPPVLEVGYLVDTPAGENLGQLVCKGQTDEGGRFNMCEFIDHTDDADPLFEFYQIGPSTLSMEYGRPLPDIGTPPGGRAVRLD